MKPIGVDELFDRNFIIDELESNLNRNYKTEASFVTEEIQGYASNNTEINERGRIASTNQDEDTL